MNAFGWALIHFLWQGTVIAAVLAVVLAVMRHRDARLRYAAGCCALIVMSICVPATTAWLNRSSRDAAVQIEKLPGSHQVLSVASAQTSWKDAATVWLDAHLVLLEAAWALGVVLLLLRLLGGWYVMRRRILLSTPLDYPLSRLMSKMEMSGTVHLLESAIVNTPQVFGWLRPVILIPAATLAQLSPEQLEAILAHELAHIRRRDFMVNLLQLVAESLFFYHPAVWWVSSRIREERELCCDDIAVEACTDRLCYTRALLLLEQMRAPMALAATGGNLRTRVERLVGLNKEAPSTFTSAVPVCAFTIVMLAAGGAWVARASQSSSAANPKPVAAGSSEKTNKGKKTRSVQRTTVTWNGEEVDPALAPAPPVPPAPPVALVAAPAPVIAPQAPAAIPSVPSAPAAAPTATAPLAPKPPQPPAAAGATAPLAPKPPQPPAVMARALAPQAPQAPAPPSPPAAGVGHIFTSDPDSSEARAEQEEARRALEQARREVDEARSALQAELAKQTDLRKRMEREAQGSGKSRVTVATPFGMMSAEQQNEVRAQMLAQMSKQKAEMDSQVALHQAAAESNAEMIRKLAAKQTAAETAAADRQRAQMVKQLEALRSSNGSAAADLAQQKKVMAEMQAHMATALQDMRADQARLQAQGTQRVMPANPSLAQRVQSKTDAEERDRRIRYADERFAKDGVLGSQTDRGKTYIHYGPPDEIESHSDREDWRYHNWQHTGQAKDFHFDANRKLKQ